MNEFNVDRWSFKDFALQVGFTKATGIQPVLFFHRGGKHVATITTSTMIVVFDESITEDLPAMIVDLRKRVEAVFCK